MHHALNSTPLLLLQRRRVDRQVEQCQIRREGLIENGCDDGRCWGGQITHPAHVAAVHPLPPPDKLPQRLYHGVNEDEVGSNKGYRLAAPTR